MPHDVFISYSHKDKAIADAICAHLEGEGIRCWYAPRDIRAGDDWASTINSSIRSSRVMVLVFSDFSNNSQQVLREVSIAVDAGVTLVPFRITRSEPADGMQYYLSTVHWLDAIDDPMGRKIEELGTLIRNILGREPVRTSGTCPGGEEPGKRTPSGSRKWLLLLLIPVIAGALWLAGVFGGRPEDEAVPAQTAVPETEAPTQEMTEAPTNTPVSTDTPAPTDTATPIPTDPPTPEPTGTPTLAPTDTPEPPATEEPETALLLPFEPLEEEKELIEGATVLGNTVYYWKAGEKPAEPERLAVFSETDQSWYLRKGARTVERGEKMDLSFLNRLPNLKELYLAATDQPVLPSLSALEHLEKVWIEDCDMENLDWLAESRIRSFTCRIMAYWMDYGILDTCPNLMERDVDQDFTCIPLEDLKKLTAEEKRHITRAMIAGEYLFNYDLFYIQEDAFNTDRTAKIGNAQSGEIIEVSQGTARALDILNGFDNLETLCIFAQPYISLDGIENCPYLRSLTVLECQNLLGVDHVIQMKGLRYLDVSYCDLVNNISELETMDWLPELVLCGLPDADYSPLSGMKGLLSLKIMDVPISSWTEPVKDLSIPVLSLGGYGTDQEELEILLQGHPEVERLEILYAGEELTDLSCLAGMPKLEKLVITDDMAHLVRTLDGLDCRFEIEFYY